MKKLFSLLPFFILLTTISYAQKVRYKKDQVTVDDKPICLITSKGFVNKDYTIKTLEGKTMATMKLQNLDPVSNDGLKYYYLINFFDSGNECEFEAIAFSQGSRLADDIAEAGLFVDAKYSEEGEKRFLNLHKRKFSEEIKARMNGGSSSMVKVENDFSGNDSRASSQGAVKSKTKFQLVERNRNGDLQVWGSKEIKQDFKKIGYYTEAREGIKVVVSIHLPDGKKVAKVIFKDAFAKQGSMTTFSDDEERVVNVNGNSVGEWVKSLSSYLIDRDYL